MLFRRAYIILSILLCEKAIADKASILKVYTPFVRSCYADTAIIAEIDWGVSRGLMAFVWFE